MFEPRAAYITELNMSIDRSSNELTKKCFGACFFPLVNPVAWQLDTLSKDAAALRHFLMAKY